MNLQRGSRILATGSVALALIGMGVGASLTDHWSATQPAHVALAGPVAPVLTITSNSAGATIDVVGKTVTFPLATITTTTSDPMFGGIYNQFTISSTGTGPISVSAMITSSDNMPQAELAKFTLDTGSPFQSPPAPIFALSGTPVVVALAPAGTAMPPLGLSIRWAGLTQAADLHNLTVTYSIDAS